MSFLETCDEATYKEFEDLAASYGFTIEQLKNENSCRVAFDIVEVQKAIEGDWKYKETNHIRSKKLF